MSTLPRRPLLLLCSPPPPSTRTLSSSPRQIALLSDSLSSLSPFSVWSERSERAAPLTLPPAPWTPQTVTRWTTARSRCHPHWLCLSSFSPPPPPLHPPPPPLRPLPQSPPLLSSAPPLRRRPLSSPLPLPSLPALPHLRLQPVHQLTLRSPHLSWSAHSPHRHCIPLSPLPPRSLTPSSGGCVLCCASRAPSSLPSLR